jgi:hypothetical protein
MTLGAGEGLHCWDQPGAHVHTGMDWRGSTGHSHVRVLLLRDQLTRGRKERERLEGMRHVSSGPFQAQNSEKAARQGPSKGTRSIAFPLHPSLQEDAERKLLQEPRMQAQVLQQKIN